MKQHMEGASGPAGRAIKAGRLIEKAGGVNVMGGGVDRVEKCGGTRAKASSGDELAAGRNRSGGLVRG